MPCLSFDFYWFNLYFQAQQKNIQLQPEQIKELADNINKTIASLPDIDTILSDTAENLGYAQKLKQQADQAKLVALHLFC